MKKLKKVLTLEKSSNFILDMDLERTIPGVVYLKARAKTYTTEQIFSFSIFVVVKK